MSRKSGSPEVNYKTKKTPDGRTVLDGSYPKPAEVPTPAKMNIDSRKKTSKKVNTHDPKEDAHRTLFHGTAVALNPGDLILPISKVEQPRILDAGTPIERAIYPSMVFVGLSKANIAYATEDIVDAKYFAEEASRNPHNHIDSAYVYEVEPLGITTIKKIFPRYKPGVDRLEHQSTEGYRVIRKVLSKTPPANQESLLRKEIVYGFHQMPWNEH